MAKIMATVDLMFNPSDTFLLLLDDLGLLDDLLNDYQIAPDSLLRQRVRILRKIVEQEGKENEYQNSL